MSILTEFSFITQKIFKCVVLVEYSKLRQRINAFKVNCFKLYLACILICIVHWIFRDGNPL